MCVFSEVGHLRSFAHPNDAAVATTPYVTNGILLQDDATLLALQACQPAAEVTLPLLDKTACILVWD